MSGSGNAHTDRPTKTPTGMGNDPDKGGLSGGANFGILVAIFIGPPIIYGIAVNIIVICKNNIIEKCKNRGRVSRNQSQITLWVNYNASMRHQRHQHRPITLMLRGLVHTQIQLPSNGRKPEKQSFTKVERA